MNHHSALRTLGLGALCLTAACRTTSTAPNDEAQLVGGGVLEINLQIAPENRGQAAAVFGKFRQPFLDSAAGAISKQLLIRSEDVQVLHGFRSKADADQYLESGLFNNDVVKALAPFLSDPPEIRVYDKLPVVKMFNVDPRAFLEITLDVASADRTAAAEVFQKYRQPFLQTADGALSKDLIIRDDDVQVIHGFESAALASAYLRSALFRKDVVAALSPLLKAPPDVRIFDVFQANDD